MGSMEELSAGNVLLRNKGPSKVSVEIKREVTPEDVFAKAKQVQGGANVDARGDGIIVNRTWETTQNTQLFGQLEYNMQHKNRGCFLIFSQENFDVEYNGRKLSKREGTRIDAVNIHEAVTKLGFEFVNTFHDLKRGEILEWLNLVSKARHDEYDCFGCAILTHGGDGEVLFARDAAMKLEEFTKPFSAENCPSLAGKPKLFFIQSCRGDKFDKGSDLSRDLDVPDGPFQQQVEERPLIIPNEADFLLAYSTVPGYVAWLNAANGSWFIQCLCYCINKFGEKLEIMQVVTRMNNMVAYRFESNNKDGNDHYKQMPSVSTRLTADLYFRKKNAHSNGYPPEDDDQGLTMADEIEVHPEQQEEAVAMPGAASSEAEAKPKQKTWMSRIRKSFRRRKH